jgi:nicotinate-nucleotide pyrophosphorylase (carboxylating)
MNELEFIAAQTLIELALREDVGDGDITTDNIIPAESLRKAKMVAKAEGVIAGLPIAEMVFKSLDPEMKWNVLTPEGTRVNKGDILVEFEGTYRALLTGERTALNFLQRLSGIATMSAKYADEVKDFKTVILDTRKTLPGFRMLDNMDLETMGKGVEMIGGRAKVEASGNMTLERLREVAATGVDFISIGALTHSVNALDISQRLED